MRMSSNGIDVDVPQGWDAEIFRRKALAARRPADGPEETTPVLHMANFALPPARGDFGSGAVEIMRSENVLVVLFEYEPEAAVTALFSSSGIPDVNPDDFSPSRMQRHIEGQSGAQYFFNLGGRAFCLYIALGSHGRRNQLVPELNQVLRTLRIGAR